MLQFCQTQSYKMLQITHFTVCMAFLESAERSATQAKRKDFSVSCQ